MLQTIALIIVYVLGGLIIYYFYKRAYSYTDYDSLHPFMPITPYNTIIVFDIHGVLFKPDYKNLIKTFLQSPDKYIFIRYALYPPVWIDFIRLRRKRAVFGKYVAHFTHLYPSLQQCVPLMTNLANTQLPIPQTVALIEHLYAQGYTLHIFSNIGKPIMEDLAHKFPHIFSYFEAIKTPSAQNNFTGKPNPLIFNEYVQENKGSQKQILFIDDTIKNLEIAKKFGMIGIYFQDPDRLKNQLLSLGISLST